MNYQNLVLGTLSNDAFVMVNKKLAQKMGFVEAGLIGEVLAIYRLCKKEGTFYTGKGGNGEEWFFITQPYIEKMLGIKRVQFENAMKNLVKEKVVLKKRLGVPSKNYYLIQWDRIAILLSDSEPENENTSSENGSEPLVQSDCMKPTFKDVGNIHTRMDETYKLECTKPTSIIRTYNNNIKTTTNKIDDDDNKGEINNLAFREFVNHFNENYPTLFDNDMFNRIYEQMHLQGLSIITNQEAVRQAKRMQQYGLEKVGDYATYFVGGIIRNRKSQQGALEERKVAEAREILEAQKSQAEAKREAVSPPFYNWLEN